MASSILGILQSSKTFSAHCGTTDESRKLEIATIASLDPSMREWTIKGKVIRKGERTRFRYTRGEGVFFSFDLVDDEGGEVRCTCYNTTANRFFDKIHAGRSYVVSNGTLKPFQNQNLIQNEDRATLVNSAWEITLGSSSSVEAEPCASETLQQDFNLMARTLFPKSTKGGKDRDDGSTAMMIEEPKTPQRKEHRRVLVQDDRSLETSEEQEELRSNHSFEAQESKNPITGHFWVEQKSIGDARSEVPAAKVPSYTLDGSPIFQRLRNFDKNEDLVPLADMILPEVREIGCGDNDISMNTDGEEWVGGQVDPADPSSYRYAWPTGWD